MKKIEVAEHRPEWSLCFKEEGAKLKPPLGNSCLNIYHIWSTAVTRVYAKPKIDTIAKLISLPESHYLPLQKIDYEFRGEFNIPMKFFLERIVCMI